MFQSLGKIILRSKIKNQSLPQKKNFLPWDNIEKIALIINEDESLNKSVIDKFIDGTKKHIEVFYLETRSKQKTYHDWHCFSKKERSLFYLPTKQTESELKNKQFDIVINTCTEKNVFAFAVSSSLKALFRCGNNNTYNLADLIILDTGSDKIVNYLENTVKYLKMIKV